MRHVFVEILCRNARVKYASITPEVLAIFLFFFRKINLKVRNIELVSSFNKFKVLSEELIGMSALWEIFSTSANKQVIQLCCEELCEVYLNHERCWDPAFRDAYMR